MSEASPSPDALLRDMLSVVGSKPTDADLQEMYAISKVTGVRDDDLMWKFYIPLQLNRHLDRQLRGQIRADFEAEKAAAEIKIGEYTASGQSTLAKAIASGVDLAAFNRNFRRFATMMITAVVSATVLIVAAASAGAVYFINATAKSAEARILAQQMASVEAQNTTANRVADTIGLALIGSMKSKFSTELDEIVNIRVQSALEWVGKQKPDVNLLLAAESRTPGILKFAQSPRAGDIKRAEERTPGLVDFMVRYGPDAMSVFAANGNALCGNRTIGADGKATCLIWAPK